MRADRGNDSIYGKNGNDDLWGNAAGDNRIEGGSGTGILTGQSGSDIFILWNNAQSIKLADFVPDFSRGNKLKLQYSDGLSGSIL